MGMERPVEIEFTLPVGYTDAAGARHRSGRLRLARAIDEIDALGHPAVAANEAYLPVAVLARVVTRLGELPVVDERVIEHLPVRDFEFLEQLYVQLNGIDEGRPHGTIACPRCAADLLDPPTPLAG
jgi:hypothetical protein